MELYVNVMFWMLILEVFFGVIVMTTTKEYPRLIKYTVAIDTYKLILAISFLVWVSYIKFIG